MTVKSVDGGMFLSRGLVRIDRSDELGEKKGRKRGGEKWVRQGLDQCYRMRQLCS